MWGIFGMIGLISPIGLWLARDWLKAGLKTVYARPDAEIPAT